MSSFAEYIGIELELELVSSYVNKIMTELVGEHAPNTDESDPPSMATVDSIVGILPRFQTNGVTLLDTLEDLQQFDFVLAGKSSIAIDSEGVVVSRVGCLTVFSVGIEVDNGVHVFVFDMLHSDKRLQAAQILSLKLVLEDDNVEKIIHDCRQDSDALYTHFHILLQNVFDTSVYALHLSKSGRRVNLNQTLRNFDCHYNDNHKSIGNMYKQNPWQARPFTPFMLEFVSKDVTSLFDLRTKLLSKVAQTMPAMTENIRNESDCAVNEFRDKPYYEIVSVPHNKVSSVIGRWASGISAIERQTGAVVPCQFGSGFLVLGSSPYVLASARSAIRNSY